MQLIQLMRRTRSIPILLLSCCLVFGFAAYAALPGVRAARLQTGPTSEALTTTCPAIGTARPAVMQPIALGSHPNIVYVFNEVPPNTTIAFGRLKRYDVTTGQKTELVTSGLSLQNAQVSGNGQWVLFLSTPDPRGDRQHSALFQLIRMDGKKLQTLYCPAASVQVTNVQWSADEKFIIFNTTDTKTQESSVILLDVATGKLRTELQTSQGQQSFQVVTWLDSKRVYILKNADQQPAENLFILDITKNKDIHGADLQKVNELVGLDTTVSFDSNFDATKLFIGQCQTPENSRGNQSDIFVESATGGPQHRIYHDPKRCLNTLRAVTSTTLLFTDTAPGGDFGIQELWKLKPDGSGLTRLFDNGGTHTNVDLNVFTQFPWSNVSRDGGKYALGVHGTMGGTQDLLVGSLNGGKPTVFVSTIHGTVFIAGWTTM